MRGQNGRVTALKGDIDVWSLAGWVTLNWTVWFSGCVTWVIQSTLRILYKTNCNKEVINLIHMHFYYKII
jgi:hypothetical protein